MRSWTDEPIDPAADRWVDAIRDTGHLLRFRASTVRRRVGAALGIVVILALTAFFAVGVAGMDHTGTGRVADLLVTAADALADNLSLLFAGHLLAVIGGAVGAGGGRELIARAEATIHPISARSEHLGALALTPLNLAWLVQGWALLAATALVATPDRLLGAQVVVGCWVLFATAVGQAVGWLVEGVRRTTHGVVAVRVTMTVLGLLLAGLHVAGLLAGLLRSLPTALVAEQMVTPDWPLTALVLVAAAAVAVWAGGAPARWALGLPPKEELRVESGVHEARAEPTQLLGSPEGALLVRLDRGSVWRSVGMRRGLMVLGIAPGLVALVAGLAWDSVVMLPGLTASGAALLFGVNAWCLDGKGMVWRETLPVPASLSFDARARVVAEVLLAVSSLPILFALLRNGFPEAQVLVSVLVCWGVVVWQVLAICMSWSVRSPYAVNLSSPRATPAPHSVMASYAGRLSLTTTVTGLVFSGMTLMPFLWMPVVVGAVFATWSGLRLYRARRRWLNREQRARIALTVATV